MRHTRPLEAVAAMAPIGSTADTSRPSLYNRARPGLEHFTREFDRGLG